MFDDREEILRHSTTSRSSAPDWQQIGDQVPIDFLKDFGCRFFLVVGPESEISEDSDRFSLNMTCVHDQAFNDMGRIQDFKTRNITEGD